MVSFGQVTGGNLEAFPLSDTTASLPSSDDEAGDMAVNVGSMLHTSLADRNGSGPGSDSGGSQVDSVSGTFICGSIMFLVCSSLAFYFIIKNRT